MHASITSCKISEKTNESISRKVHHRLSDPSEEHPIIKNQFVRFWKNIKRGQGIKNIPLKVEEGCL